MSGPYEPDGPTGESRGPRSRPADLRAISFDFGNTLVPVRREDLRRVVERMMDAVIERSGPFERTAFGRAWAEERERQFAEEVPRMREVDLDRRTIRVLARMRGAPPPPPGVPWDDAAAAERSEPAEIGFAVDAYSRAFVELLPPPPAVGPLLERLADRFAIGILSNWPLAATIERYVDAAGWRPWLTAVVVSQRVGRIKPDPLIFAVAEAELGVPPSAILHVGDDWAADVMGAHRAGWRVAYLRDRPADSPLPSSARPPVDDRGEATPVADVELDRLVDLEGWLGG